VARGGSLYFRYTGLIISLHHHLRIRRSAFSNALAYRYSHNRASRYASDEMLRWQLHEGASREVTVPHQRVHDGGRAATRPGERSRAKRFATRERRRR
jgi:hypothetical protein